jgi:hypothetical protein
MALIRQLKDRHHHISSRQSLDPISYPFVSNTIWLLRDSWNLQMPLSHATNEQFSRGLENILYLLPTYKASNRYLQLKSPTVLFNFYQNCFYVIRMEAV